MPFRSVLLCTLVATAGGKLRGDPAPVASPITRLVASSFPGAFSASANGVLAFRRGGVIAEDRLVWFDRSGKSLGTVGGVADYTNPALSPDGNRLAVGIRDPSTARRDVWILDLARDAASRFTFDPADDFNPSWSPDRMRIAGEDADRSARPRRNDGRVGRDLSLQSVQRRDHRLRLPRRPHRQIPHRARRHDRDVQRVGLGQSRKGHSAEDDSHLLHTAAISAPERSAQPNRGRAQVIVYKGRCVFLRNPGFCLRYCAPYCAVHQFTGQRPKKQRS